LEKEEEEEEEEDKEDYEMEFVAMGRECCKTQCK
jgi:hypothetical protein